MWHVVYRLTQHSEAKCFQTLFSLLVTKIFTAKREKDNPGAIESIQLMKEQPCFVSPPNKHTSPNWDWSWKKSQIQFLHRAALSTALTDTNNQTKRWPPLDESKGLICRHHPLKEVYVTFPPSKLRFNSVHLICSYPSLNGKRFSPHPPAITVFKRASNNHFTGRTTY